MWHAVPATSMTTCLYHGDYGAADPAFVASRSPADAQRLRQGARNAREALAIQRQDLRGEKVVWCDQGYAWAEQDAVHWLLIAAFVFVALPYLALRLAGRWHGSWSRRKTGGVAPNRSPLKSL